MFTHLLIVTGCRRGEIAGLKWKNVDLKAAKIRIDCTLLYAKGKGIYENTTKTGDIRNLSIPSETVTLLEEYQAWWDNLKEKNTTLFELIERVEQAAGHPIVQRGFSSY